MTHFSFQHYWQCSRSIYYGIIAALPLLVLYELLLFSGNGQLRNAGEVWIRQLLNLLYISPAWAGLVMIGALLALLPAVRSYQTPLRGSYFGIMFVEALIFSWLLAPVLNWVLGFIPSAPSAFPAAPVAWLNANGMTALSLSQGIEWAQFFTSMGSTQIDFSSLGIAQLESFDKSGPLEKFGLALGAGLFEEFLFRVILVSGLLMGFRLLFPQWLAAGLAIVLAAILFSLAHHIATPFQWDQFLFRFGGGLLFTVLYYVRGFAITAYTHALYDIQVIFL